MRQQIKWVAFGRLLSPALSYLIAMLSQLVMLIAVSGRDSGVPHFPWWADVLFSVAVLGFAGVPVAIGLAVLKYRLYEIDIIINRTLVYGSLTATLAAGVLRGRWPPPRRSSAFYGDLEQPPARHRGLDARDRGAVQPPQAPASSPLSIDAYTGASTMPGRP